MLQNRVKLHQSSNVVGRVIQLFFAEVAAPVRALLLFRQFFLEVALYNAVETVLRIRQAIGEKSAGQHGATDPPSRIDVVLLEPAKVEDSVMGQPESVWRAEELAEISPVAFIKLKTVDQNDSVAIPRT